MPSKSWDQMREDVDAIARVGRFADGRRYRDILDPVHEPLRNRPPLAGFSDVPVVAAALQLTDLADGLGLSLDHDVAPVGPAVVLDADGYSAVPVSVTAEIDRRCA